VTATVEKVDAEAELFYVSIAGLSKPQMFKDLEVGSTVDGTVVSRAGAGVYIDIGYEDNVLLSAKVSKDVFKLEPNEEVKGLKVENVDLEKLTATVSFHGLSDLVSDRPAAESSKAKRAKKGGAAPADSEAKTPDLRPVADVKVGETFEGTVGGITQAGNVFVEVGCQKQALVIAAGSDRRNLKRRQAVTATVEKVDAEAELFYVSIVGLSKPRMFKDLKVGSTVDGIVCSRSRIGVFIDIGYEADVLLRADVSAKSGDVDVFKLEQNEELKGLQVENVDLEKRVATVSFPGLSDLVSDRPERPPNSKSASGSQ